MTSILKVPPFHDHRQLNVVHSTHLITGMGFGGISSFQDEQGGCFLDGLSDEYSQGTSLSRSPSTKTLAISTHLITVMGLSEFPSFQDEQVDRSPTELVLGISIISSLSYYPCINISQSVARAQSCSVSLDHFLMV